MTAISRASNPKRSAVPASTIAAAMNGFADERRKIGLSISPSARCTFPCASTAHAATACTDSIIGPRVTSTSGMPESTALFARAFVHLNEARGVDPLCERLPHLRRGDADGRFGAKRRRVERQVRDRTRDEAADDRVDAGLGERQIAQDLRLRRAQLF